VLVLAREVDHLRHLGLRHLVGENSAHRDALLMDLEHDPCRVLDPHREEALQHENDELHRRIIVVEHQHFIVGWLLGLGPGARRDSGLDLVEAIVARPSGHHDQARNHFLLKYGKSRKRGKTGLSSSGVKNGGRSVGERPPQFVALT
jgi:hypothetical protein